MSKLWKGRMDENDPVADSFNSSISIDGVLYKQDIIGSIAHAVMLGNTGIIKKEDSELIVSSLEEILEDIEAGKLIISKTEEDIHSFVENELTKRIGDKGKMLHTARSRNDQVALDIRLYLKGKTEEIINLLSLFLDAIAEKANENLNTIMPGYTHLQKAQPVTYAHYLMSYGMMFLRDLERMKDSLKRCTVSPIGSCALAGTTYPIDRVMEGELLGLKEISKNSMDSVSDRDFCLEFMSNAAILMMHLSRLSEEVILFSSGEFNYIEISDAYSTGSSIMPQKKNPDIAELVRGKTGRVYGNLFALLTVMKGLPLAYNKDMQEDKEALFDSVDTVINCLKVYIPMLKAISVKKEAMEKAAAYGYMNATDLADYLTKKGMPFRDAYKLTGKIVADAIKMKKSLEEIKIEEYKAYSPVFSEDLYGVIDIKECVKRRNSEGGPAPESVKSQIDYIKEEIKKI
ncbi:MAG: Argininosuccinate lyase 1 [Firmicutes bacterium ADurb.Bin080]|jgi:argininosuccinate lyase|nr:argininosuccinate lyase [Clostridiales bacterium]OQC15822.1 MAG: Argininosuccinate lyase 1 [Firmicutes bacterium ADurb.Bin080]